MMTVKDLLKRLRALDPETTVLEESRGALRFLRERDVVEDLFYTPQMTADAEEVRGRVLIFRAWS